MGRPLRIRHKKGRHLEEFARGVLEGFREVEGVDDILHPDHFFSWVFKYETGDEWFDKAKLTEIVEGKVGRPRSMHVHFPTKRLVRPGEHKKAVDGLERALEREGSVYVKRSADSARGRKVARMRRAGRGLEIRTDDPELFEKLDRSVPKEYKRDKRKGQMIIRLGGGQKLQDALHRVAAAFSGPYIIEKEMKVPRYGGRTWEVRTIVQSPKGVPEVTGHYAKLGAKGKVVSNIAMGGQGRKTEEVVSGVYRERYPGKRPDEINRLTDEFMGKLKREAIKAMGEVNSHNEGLRERYIPDFPEGGLHARHGAVDIAAEFDPGTGKLEPVVGEVQYPDCGISGLRDADPEAWNRVNENKDKMAWEGRNMLFKAFGMEG